MQPCQHAPFHGRLIAPEPTLVSCYHSVFQGGGTPESGQNVTGHPHSSLLLVVIQSMWNPLGWTFAQLQALPENFVHRPQRESCASGQNTDTHCVVFFQQLPNFIHLLIIPFGHTSSCFLHGKITDTLHKLAIPSPHRAQGQGITSMKSEQFLVALHNTFTLNAKDANLCTLG